MRRRNFIAAVGAALARPAAVLAPRAMVIATEAELRAAIAAGARRFAIASPIRLTSMVGLPTGLYFEWIRG